MILFHRGPRIRCSRKQEETAGEKGTSITSITKELVNDCPLRSSVASRKMPLQTYSNVGDMSEGPETLAGSGT